MCHVFDVKTRATGFKAVLLSKLRLNANNRLNTRLHIILFISVLYLVFVYLPHYHWNSLNYSFLLLFCCYLNIMIMHLWNIFLYSERRNHHHLGPSKGFSFSVGLQTNSIFLWFSAFKFSMIFKSFQITTKKCELERFVSRPLSCIFLCFRFDRFI